MTTIIIPKKLIKNDDLMIIPRKEYEILQKALVILRERKEVTESDILRWSKEVKELKKTNRLPVLHSLRDLR